MPPLTCEEFVEKFSGKPCGMDVIADWASDVSDAPALVEAAKAFVQAERRLQAALEAVGFEIG